MKLIVFSDSHNSGLKRMIRVLEAEKTYDAVFFLGDGEYDADGLAKYLGSCPFYRVQGNCDYGSSDYPLDGLVPFGGYLFYYTHGHKQGAKTGMGGLFLEGMRSGANVVMFGHTHVPFNKIYEGFHFFNPGSITNPRGNYPTYGRICLPTAKSKKITFEIVEIER